MALGCIASRRGAVRCGVLRCVALRCIVVHCSALPRAQPSVFGAWHVHRIQGSAPPTRDSVAPLVSALAARGERAGGRRGGAPSFRVSRFRGALPWLTRPLSPRFLAHASALPSLPRFRVRSPRSRRSLAPSLPRVRSPRSRRSRRSLAPSLPRVRSPRSRRSRRSLAPSRPLPTLPRAIARSRALVLPPSLSLLAYRRCCRSTRRASRTTAPSTARLRRRSARAARTT